MPNSPVEVRVLLLQQKIFYEFVLQAKVYVQYRMWAFAFFYDKEIQVDKSAFSMAFVLLLLMV
jgi:hypothetical protein